MKRRSQALQGSNLSCEAQESPGFSRGEDIKATRPEAGAAPRKILYPRAE